MSALERYYLLLCLAATGSAALLPRIPDDMSISWQHQPVRSLPVVQNFYGAAVLRRDVSPGYGLIGLGPVTFAPFVGTFQNSTLRFNGKPVAISGSVDHGWCTARRSGRSATIRVDNHVRMPFEQRGVLQRWDVSASNARPLTVDVQLDGPFFRRCDNAGKTSLERKFHGVCGWTVQIPTERNQFKRTIVPHGKFAVAVVEDRLTNATAASAFWLQCGGGSECPGQPQLELASSSESLFSGGFVASANVSAAAAGGNISFQMRMASGVGESLAEALAILAPLLDGDDNSGYDAAFDKACTSWDDRWRSAFLAEDEDEDEDEEKASLAHYSGWLPRMASNRPELDKLFHWASLALVSLERTNMRSFPRQFVISEGPSFNLTGGTGNGGSGQFSWDLSFSAVSTSLLEPNGSRVVLTHMLANANWTDRSRPIGIPQAWDAYPALDEVLQGHYWFDFVSIFYFVNRYVSLTGDIAWLFDSITNVHDPSVTYTPLAFLQRITWAWQHWPTSQVSKHLVDYGSNKRDFLEVVPTYTNVIPSLQFGNAGMMYSFARLLEQLTTPNCTEGDGGGSSSSSSSRRLAFALGLRVEAGDADAAIKDEIAALRSNASATMHAVVEHLYVEDGVFRCLNNTDTKSGKRSVPVRAINDMIYGGMALGVLGRDAALPTVAADVREAVADFFKTELLSGNGWVRALSLKDPIMANVECVGKECGIDDLLATRPDWTGTGGYGGLGGYAVDAAAAMTQGFDLVFETLSSFAVVADATRGTMPAQGIAVSTPPYLKHFLDDNDGLPAPQHAYAPAFPEFYDNAGGRTPEGGKFPSFIVNSARSVQNAEASLADAIVQTVFGWRPDWTDLGLGLDEDRNSSRVRDAVQRALFLPHVARTDSFRGTLSGVHTPYGRIDITASDKGLEWAWTRKG